MEERVEKKEQRTKRLNKETITFVLLERLNMGRDEINAIVEMVWNSNEILESIQHENDVHNYCNQMHGEMMRGSK